MNLAQLDTLISISPEGFPKQGAFDARRAVARIAQAQSLDPAAVPAANAAALFEQLKGTLPGKEHGNLRPNLKRALALDPLPGEVLDRIRRGEQTLADALLAAERQPTLATTGRVPGALKLFAATLRLRPEEIPALGAFVDEKFSAWTPTVLNMKPANFANFRWRVRRGVELVDLAARQSRMVSQLSGAWAELARTIRPKEGLRTGKGKGKRTGLEGWLAKLYPLVVYCGHHGIEPRDVGDGTVTALHADLARRGVANPFEIARNVVYAWQTLQRRVPSFPRQKLARIYRNGFMGERVHKVPYRALPDAFQASFEAYVLDHFGAGGMPGSMADLVPGDSGQSFAELADTLCEPEPQVRRKDTAVNNYRTVLTYAANVVIAAGGIPADVADMATPEILARVLDAIWARQKERGQTEKKNAFLYSACNILIAVARDSGRPQAAIDRMVLLRDHVDPHFICYRHGRRRDGTRGTIRVRADWKIGPRHAERLRQFNEDSAFKAWFQLPYLLFDGVKRAVADAKAKNARLDRETVNDAIAVLYHGVARCAPLRRENFAALRHDGREIRLDLPKTPGQAGYIVVPAALTKNGKELTIELYPVVADWFRFWMAEVRPHCAGASRGNPHVFPSDAGGYRDAGGINALFVKRNWKRGGFKLNTHVCRHLSAKIILDADPSKMALVQTLLGHKSLKTTETYYGQVNQIIAQRWYQDALAETARKLGLEAIG